MTNYTTDDIYYSVDLIDTDLTNNSGGKDLYFHKRNKRDTIIKKMVKKLGSFKAGQIIITEAGERRIYVFRDVPNSNIVVETMDQNNEKIVSTRYFDDYGNEVGCMV